MVFGCITLFKLLHKISLTYLLPAMFPNPWNKVSSHVEKICVKALCVCVFDKKLCIYVCVCGGGKLCVKELCVTKLFLDYLCVTVRCVKK